MSCKVFTLFLILFISCVVFVSSENGKKTRLIKFSENDSGTLMSPEDVDMLTISERSHFMDVTEHPSPIISKATLSPVVGKLRQEKLVDELAKLVSEANLNSTIGHLSSYFTRYYTTDTGVSAVNWLLSKYQEIVASLPPARRERFSCSLFKHTAYPQPSLICKFKGKTLPDESVIIGGHIDSTAGGPTVRSPGADDDATGSSTVLETFRVIAVGTHDPDRTIEWHAYAAEEVGLRGSQDIATAYAREGRKVHGMLQCDMTGWNSATNAGKIGVITDFTDAQTNEIVRNCLTRYGQLPWDNTVCGYACSDHASWTRHGFRSAFAFEVRDRKSVV